MPPARAPRRVLLLAVPAIQPLDLFGPFEVFRGANAAGGGRPPYWLEVASWRARDVATDSGVALAAGSRAPFGVREVDTFLVVGGEGPGRRSTSAAISSVDGRRAERRARADASEPC